MAQKPAQAAPAPGTESTVPGPKNDDGRANEQDGQNRLLSESEHNDRRRGMENE